VTADLGRFVASELLETLTGTALRAGMGVIVERDAQSILKRTSTLCPGGGDPGWEKALRSANPLTCGRPDDSANA